MNFKYANQTKLVILILMLGLVMFERYELSLIAICLFATLDLYYIRKNKNKILVNRKTLKKILKYESNTTPKELLNLSSEYKEYEIFLEKITASIENIQNSRMVEKILTGEENNTLVQLILEMSDVVESERQDFLQQKVELISKNKDLELAHKSLEDKSCELEKLAQHRSLFLANMSHEFRTPLNGIINFSSFALDENDNDEKQSYLESIRESGQHLLGIINDVLDLASIEAGSFSLVEENFNLNKKVNFVIELAKSLAKEKGIEIISCIENDIPNLVYGDSRRFTQVLINLISNSIKFNKKDGAIILVINKGAITEKGLNLNIEITDTGNGITKEFQKVMFEPFSQADISHKRCHEGTGLGLTITAHILSLMKGDIQISSRGGVGTQFKLTIPFSIKNKENKEEKENHLELINKKLSILVAEDNSINQKIINKIISDNNHDVKIASDGLSAFEEYKANDFDLILMDIQMPEMDGIETTKMILEHEKETNKKHIPIIAFTAHALKQQKEKYLDNGMEGFVTKPIDKKELWKEVRRVLYKN